MANPLDGLTRVYIYGDEATPEGEAMAPSPRGNTLERALAPPAPTKLEEGLAALKAFVENFGRDFGLAGVPKTHPQRAELEDMNNALLGLNGRERVQLWPERMVRSGFSLPGEVAQGIEPVVDPNTGRTSVPLIERAQDTAGLAFPGALTQKAGTATLGSGPVRPAMKPAMKPETPAPVFYSALEHTISNASAKEMLPGDWAGWIKNQPGVKAEELAWTGLPDWLAQQKGKVSKKDVQAYLDEHKVEVQDVTKSAQHGADEAIGTKADELAREFLEGEGIKEGTPEWKATYDSIFDDMMIEADSQLRGGEDGGGSLPKYEDYQLPGGENYREHLLTLPPRGISKEAFAKLQAAERKAGDAYDRYLQKMTEKYGPAGDGFGKNWLGKATPEEMTKFKQTRDAAIQAGDELIAAKQKIDGQRGEYQSSHWDEPNVLAHVRTNERDVGGKPSLHIEEIQSDWHQEGRKKGYKSDERPATKEEIERGGARTNDQGVPVVGGSRSAVPDAPFKTSWPELALKRMIRMAAEEGKSRISWTPGEAQAARYNLSKTLRELHYQPQTGKLMAWSHDKAHYRPVVNQENVPVDKLADFVGKEGAEKLLKQDLNRQGYHILKGEELKVGGEGMKGFYDNMLPKMVEKLGKQHGVKVQKQAVPAPEIIETKTGGGKKAFVLKGNDDAGPFWSRQEAEKWIKDNNPPDLFYFDIPPAWSEQAVGKGFSLFQAGIPFPLVPVDYNPFEKKK